MKGNDDDNDGDGNGYVDGNGNGNGDGGGGGGRECNEYGRHSTTRGGNKQRIYCIKHGGGGGSNTGTSTPLKARIRGTHQST